MQICENLFSNFYSDMWNSLERKIKEKNCDFCTNNQNSIFGCFKPFKLLLENKKFRSAFKCELYGSMVVNKNVIE